MTLQVTRADLDVPGPLRTELEQDDVAARLARKDATLWGPDAESEAAVRLGWLDLPATSRPLLASLAELRAELVAEGLDRIVLCGMGGSSLAPEVICRTAGVPLVVLDTTDPGQVLAAMTDLERTVVVVSSKSGGTVETESQRRAFVAAFARAGLDEAETGRRFVVVTDPGSPLAETASAMGARAVFLADPTVGGRYSALSAFGLVPSALAGADVTALVDDAERLAERLAEPGNPALELGLALGAAFRADRDKLALADAGETPIEGFGDWAEQLIAESTGKEGRGILPVVLESPEAPGGSGPDVLLGLVGADAPPAGPAVCVTGPLGAQFLGWEYATAVAGRVLGINPFDQPNVTESKENTQAILAAGLPDEPAEATIGAVEIRGTAELLQGVDLTSHDGLSLTLDALLAAVPPRGYLAVMAYLDRLRDARAAEVRAALAKRTEQAVTFGWGPRFLHSTGQYHKGGPQVGVFLQITGAADEDLPVPDQPYTFGTLQAAQAAGDRKALADRDRPLLHLHLTDRAAGIDQLLTALHC
ncbi:glucose-6-phosphate isomerase [Blastococcus sp. MG754426]|uniref:glucose-6-phosphate isomerase n=1 Tax=unclassified Blastococcus TaxID=2619396 RepID=UPI001EF0CAD8|nr:MULTISPECIES: glucose-6-phosphate isomerase [unclassified Blastococcus]MCF6508035.1 glucose-6-phosphate isomerase [Blastococcus sp. MG754426]MCF6512804.1 glucose-6-phosphate isomerase [Blastococcus sp. MG754427]